jgi:chemotaxis protein methyltransferase CheR
VRSKTFLSRPGYGASGPECLQTGGGLDLTEKDYTHFRKFIYEKSGINLHLGKKELLKARLAKTLRNSPFQSVQEYYRYLIESDEGGEECIHLLDSISTNLTYFFREPAHYEFLSRVVLPELLPILRARKQKKIVFWSAGCSSGEEPYSLAMTLLEYFKDRPEWDMDILATDISTRMLKSASAGIYPAGRLEKIPLELTRRYFQKGTNQWMGYFKVKPAVRGRITFERFNLIEPLPDRERFHIIFCRNVMIYFDKPTQEKIVEKFFQALQPKGYLFIGHAESLTGISHSFKYIRPSVYRK